MKVPTGLPFTRVPFTRQPCWPVPYDTPLSPEDAMNVMPLRLSCEYIA